MRPYVADRVTRTPFLQVSETSRQIASGPKVVITRRIAGVQPQRDLRQADRIAWNDAGWGAPCASQQKTGPPAARFACDLVAGRLFWF